MEPRRRYHDAADRPGSGPDYRMLSAAALRYGERMPQNAEEISPVCVPAPIGAAVLDAEPLRHGQGNAATGGIWRVRGRPAPRSSR